MRSLAIFSVLAIFTASLHAMDDTALQAYKREFRAKLSEAVFEGDADAVLTFLPLLEPIERVPDYYPGGVVHYPLPYPQRWGSPNCMTYQAPLCEIIERGSRDMIKRVLDACKNRPAITPSMVVGRDPEVVDIVGFRPPRGELVAREEAGLLQLSCFRSNGFGIVRLLLSRGHTLDCVDRRIGTKLLIAALNHGDINMAQTLRERGASLSLANQISFSPLCSASFRGDVPVVSYLLDECHVCPNQHAIGGKHSKPLHLACSSMADAVEGGYVLHAKRQFDIMRLLLHAGASVTDTDQKGDTPLHELLRSFRCQNCHHFMPCRCDNNDQEVERLGRWLAAPVRMLVQAGAQVTVPNSTGTTPCDLVRMAGLRRVKDELGEARWWRKLARAVDCKSQRVAPENPFSDAPQGQVR